MNMTNVIGAFRDYAKAPKIVTTWSLNKINEKLYTSWWLCYLRPLSYTI